MPTEAVTRTFCSSIEIGAERLRLTASTNAVIGAGSVSDMKLQLGFDVTDPNVSQEVFASNMGIVKQFIQNRLAGLNSLRYQSSTVAGNGTGPSVESPFGTGSPSLTTTFDNLFKAYGGK